MTEQFLGEIRMYGFGQVPRGWALCDGQTLPIATNQALFSLLGTYYGGNGQTTFMLPNLKARIPIHYGTGNGDNYLIAETAERQATRSRPARCPPTLTRCRPRTAQPWSHPRMRSGRAPASRPSVPRRQHPCSQQEFNRADPRNPTRTCRRTSS